MAKLQGFKRLQKEDFPPELNRAVDQIGYSVNVFAEEVLSALDSNINFDNLNQKYINITTDVDAFGVPNDELIIKPTTKGLLGFQCIYAENVESDVFVTSNPFISFQRLQNGSVRVTNISGLPANVSFKLTLIVIGT